MSTDVQSIIDPKSGLFTEAFLRATLPTRVATARRAMKQLGLVLIGVQPVAPSSDPIDTAPVGALIRDTLRDSDTGVLLDDGRFALLLEFTPVEGCVIIANRLADRLGSTHPDLAMSAGVASYPVHAMDASELFTAADRVLREATEAGAGTVSVAPIAD